MPVRRRSPFDYTIQGLPNCLCLWKVVEAEALTKNLPNLVSTSLLLMETKAKCPGLSTVLKRWIELYYFFKLHYGPRVVNACCTTRQSAGSTYLPETVLPASCYLPECLDGAWHRPTGWLDKHSIDWLLDLPLMLVRGITKFLHFASPRTSFQGKWR